jgi:hypothetical protein
MARAKYYIKKQVEGEEIEELADFTRKDKAERFLNGLFREYKKTIIFILTGYAKVISRLNLHA